MKNIIPINIQGYSKLVGLPYCTYDCWLIAVMFYKEVYGIELKRYCNEIPNNTQIAYSLIQSNLGDLERINPDEKSFGDILLIYMYGVESHIAIYLGSNKILHTSKNTGCIIESFSKWQKLISGVYRITERAVEK
jgi:cell wall-associated NlpC family hydrolase